MAHGAMKNHHKAPEKSDITPPPYELPFSSIVSFDRWLESIGKTPATGWRWRKKGWLVTLNICGRVYIRRDEIARFEQRAAAGEFAKIHATPTRKGEGR
jgi:hypothetical protein